MHLADPAGCSATVGKACGFTYAGLRVEAGQVTDTVTPTCDPPPAKHHIWVQLEYKPFDGYAGIGRVSQSWTIPDATGFPIRLAVPCSRGWWRTDVRVDGVGPANSDGTPGKPFDYREYGSEKYLSAEQCQGG
jgi:hypothetical protein